MSSTAAQPCVTRLLSEKDLEEKMTPVVTLERMFGLCSAQLAVIASNLK